MTKYIIVHNKHEGCYDYQCYDDEITKIRLTSIRINPPKLFFFDDKEQANDFFNDYINDVDCTDPKCKKGEDVEHVDYCTCGVIELDDEGNPNLFYNKLNQIFFLEMAGATFLPKQSIKTDITNFNNTNILLRKCRKLGKEQKQKYIELGEMCKECMSDEV